MDDDDMGAIVVVLEEIIMVAVEDYDTCWCLLLINQSINQFLWEYENDE